MAQSSDRNIPTKISFPATSTTCVPGNLYCENKENLYTRSYTGTRVPGYPGTRVATLRMHREHAKKNRKVKRQGCGPVWIQNEARNS
eukprot:3616353-Rhodomonas_salina.5